MAELTTPCYISVLAHLSYVFKHHATDRESQKVVQWMYLFLASWECRITVAALVDVLEICYHHKNRLENAASLEKVKEISSQLRAALGAYCDKNSALAKAMSGEGGHVAETFHAEKVCRLWRQQRDKDFGAVRNQGWAHARARHQACWL